MINIFGDHNQVSGRDSHGHGSLPRKFFLVLLVIILAATAELSLGPFGWGDLIQLVEWTMP